MGRKKLNRTKNEFDELNRIRLRKYYNKHRNKIKQKNLKRYYERKSKRNI